MQLVTGGIKLGFPSFFEELQVFFSAFGQEKASAGGYLQASCRVLVPIGLPQKAQAYIKATNRLGILFVI
jgi:hypothetical protein